MRRTNKLSAFLLAAGLTTSTAQAIDTDIYTVAGGGSTAVPNILFIFDNSANWGANYNGTDKKTIEHEALYKFLDALADRLTNADATDDVALKLALMGATDSNSPRGGKVLKHFAPIDVDNLENIGAIKSLLYTCDNVKNSDVSGCTSAFTAALAAGHADTGPTWTQLQTELQTEGLDLSNSGDKLASLVDANSAKYATTFYEAHEYFAGKTPVAGTGDGSGSYDPDAISGGKYVSPIEANEDGSEVCTSKNYIVLVGNGQPDSGENTQAEAGLDTLSANKDVVQINPDNYESNWADEYSRFLFGTDVNTDVAGNQNIISYVIDVFDSSGSQTKPDQAGHALLRSVAAQGKGAYFSAADVAEVVDALTKILDEIEAVNDVFAATALPISVNVRGTNLNQIYIGVFRPDSAQKPLWFGNMKLYTLSVDTNDNIQLSDADGNDAASTATGFIKDTARSFWTHSSTFWSHNPDGIGGESDAPDGDLVEKGAAAQQLRDAGYSGRAVYTCVGCAAGSDLTLSAQSFSDGNSAITAAALGASGATAGEIAAQRTAIIDWTRGKDLLDEDGDGVTSEIRPSVHGDVLHSRPAVISYGAMDAANPDKEFVYVYYGANDGAFHAIKGGVDESIGATDGDEIWSFVAEEHFDQLKTLYVNDPLATNYDKPFFADGGISSYIETTTADDDGDGTVDRTYVNKAYIYLSMRRGGNFLYALDVSTPAAPKLLWKINQSDTGFTELGQTWSTPVVSKIAGYSNPVLIFGLGYDATADDAGPDESGNLAGTATAGRGLMIVDAIDGSLVWQAGNGDNKPVGATAAEYLENAALDYSVPAELTVIDRDRNGYADRIYFGDTGGQLWRLDLFDSNRANWNLTRLLTVGGNQKFLSAPDVAASDNPLDPYDAVEIGTGDREHPFETATQNYFILFKDRTQTASNYSGSSNLTLSNLANATTSANLIADSNVVNGWYISLLSGEKVTSKPAIVGGITFFNTYQPEGCNNLGTARNYQINYLDATAAADTNQDGSIDDGDRAQVVAGGGFIPDPVPVIVDIDGTIREAVISGTQVQTVETTELGVRQRVFWMKAIDE